MTPYAELLIDPRKADDKSIGMAYRGLARFHHPDRPHGNGQPGPRWYSLTEAYGLINTCKARDVWRKKQTLLSGGCKACNGYGVIRLRVGMVSVCKDCEGEGRRSSARA